MGLSYVDGSRQLYDLRREPVMRKAREFITGKFWPTKAEEVLKDYFKEDNPQVLKSVYKDFIMNIHPDGIMKKEWMEDSLQAAEFFGDKDPLSVDKIFSSAFTPIEAK